MKKKRRKMPELPEVETIRRGLKRFILKKKIINTEILCDKSFIGPKELIKNQEIVAIRRFGKALVVDFANQISMLIHLRMTGQLIYRTLGTESGKNLLEMIEAGDFKTKLADRESFAGGHPTDSFFSKLPNKQTRVIFHLAITDNATTSPVGTLFFNDQRKFGFCKLIPTQEVMQDGFIKKLAKEPWDMDDVEFKQKLMRHKNAEIKPTILDQHTVAGLGNIYADEALYLAKIHPERIVGTLTDLEISNLLKSACEVMQISIDSGGSTMSTYLKADGTKGDYLQKFAQVFRRVGKPCGRCGHEIIKIKVAGRGTHLCPYCQNKEKK